MSETSSAVRGDLSLTVLAAVLTVGTGAMDVVSFSRLGGVFSSVMTGNLVVFGFGVSRGDAGLLTHTLVAVVGYVVGVLGGSLIVGRPRVDGPVWPRRVTAGLYVELLVLCGFTVGWEVNGARPGPGAQLGLLVMASAAMGMQSAAMRGLGGRAAVSTTYLTGTLTGVVSALLTPGHRGRVDVRGLVILAALTCGAAAGALVIATVPAVLPVVPLAALGGVIATSAMADR
jgi:uncharacterized membrane protein YoaK (UPF0700 family)